MTWHLCSLISCRVKKIWIGTSLEVKSRSNFGVLHPPMSQYRFPHIGIKATLETYLFMTINAYIYTQHAYNLFLLRFCWSFLLSLKTLYFNLITGCPPATRSMILIRNKQLKTSQEKRWQRRSHKPYCCKFITRRWTHATLSTRSVNVNALPMVSVFVNSYISVYFFTQWLFWFSLYEPFYVWLIDWFATCVRCGTFTSLHFPLPKWNETQANEAWR